MIRLPLSSSGPLVRAATVLALLAAPSLASAGVVLTKIADTGTTVPGGNGGNFSTNFSGPAIANGVVAFYGAGGARVGIYTGNGAGGVVRVADNTSPIPSGVGNYYDFGAPSISGGKVAFQGYGTTSGATGVYTGSAGGGSLVRVVDTTMNAPGAGRISNFVYAPDIVDGAVSFHGVYSRNGAGYGSPFTASGGVITSMVTTAEIDGFGSIGATQLSGTGAVAFYGYKYSNYGIYTGNGGPLTTIADRLTLVPGINAQFAGFGNPSILGNTVVFSGNSSGVGSTVYGIFAGSGGPLSTLVDSHTAIPGGTGNFAAFGADVALSSQGLAFTALDSVGRNGLYLLIGGTITKVAAEGDILDGKVISSLALTSNGLDGSTVAFRAGFVGGSQGIFIGSAAVVPEPSTLALAGVGLGAALALRRRNRRHVETI